MTTETMDKKRELFDKSLDVFRTQFKVRLEPTSYSHGYNENDGIAEEEFFVKDLISGPLNFDIGGWFSHDTRDNRDNIYCLLAVKLDGKDLHDCKGLQSFYDIKTGEWSELKYDSF